MKEIKSDNYSIWLGENSLSKLDISGYSKVAILVDENTKQNCLPKLPKIEDSIIIEVTSGEINKSISSCNYIWEQLSEHNFDRDSLLINLGGGVIGDMGGFCASTYKRGIDFIQVPTTLLAMVDASVGGKLGVDFNGLKNQVGLYSNPELVIINPIFLQTLAVEELKSGFAEVVKHALISDKNLWKELTATPFDKLNWEAIILTSIQIKNNIILSDPFEKGNRKKLNFGHTFGHAVESYYLKKGTPILHGDAVLMGILLEVEISVVSQEQNNEIKNYILSNFSLPFTPKKSDLLPFLMNDKKNQVGKINFSLLTNIGTCSVDNLFSTDEL